MKRTVAIHLTLITTTSLLGGCSKATAETSTSGALSSMTPPTTNSARHSSLVPTPKDYAAPEPARVGVLAPGTGIAVGEHIPDLSARDLSGKVVSLASLYEAGPILLVFYRGGWCPYCNMEIHLLTGAYGEFEKRGVTPVAISVDRPDAESILKATYVIPFPVLSDVDARVLEGFHVAQTVPPDIVAGMRSKGIELEQYSGEKHHKIAIPSLFLIDRDGIVRWAHSDPDFKVRPRTLQILAAIDSVQLTK